MSTPPMIIVANRLPYSLKRDANEKLTRHSSAGGLVTAMIPVIKQCHGTWIGWPGLYLSDDDVMPESESADAADSISDNQIRPVNIPSNLFDEFYNGCCNGTFWPLLHSMPGRAIFRREHWQAYVQVNQMFAEETFTVIKRQVDSAPEQRPPLVWIHDYQLMQVGNLVRQMLEEHNIVNTRLAFFLHIPFPPWDIFRLFPWHDVILVGMLGCDLIGFHVEGYVDNFLECCQKGLGCQVDRDRCLVQHDGRSIRVQPFPIGVPFADFEKMAREVSKDTVLPDKSLKLVLGVDRLDYTKGIVHRLIAFEKLLENYPEHLEKTLLLQIAVPSRTDVEEYQDLKDEIDREVGRINGRFSTSCWSPIRYIYRFMKQEDLCAFYKAAFVALVTPVRDGMNLVAKEYVACQVEEPGVLILSPFTGAGETMHEALIANPLEAYSLADTIHHALTMPLDERELRMSALRHRERTRDIHFWVKSFLQATGAYANMGSPELEPLTVPQFEKWLAGYVGTTQKLALLLDYDGTLSPIASHPDLATLPAETKKVLEHLATYPDVYLSVISGRSVKSVKTMVAMENITYAGNHGLDIEHPDGTRFIHPDMANFAGQISDLKEELKAIGQGESAWVEEKGFTLTLHYRSVPLERRQAIVDEATAIILKNGFRPTKAHCAVEARPPISWDKGRASIYILRTTFGIDWSERVRIIYVGDDDTDEDAIRALKGMASTFRVANSRTQKTAANHRLPDTNSVLTLLRWVETHMEKRERNRKEAAPI